MFFNNKTKLKKLSDLVLSCDQYIPFLIITETHLKSQHFDAEVQIPDYSIIRADRPVIKKGGAAIYVHKDLVIDNSYTFADRFCQAAVVYNSKHNLLIAGVYRPPPAEEPSFTACLNKLQEVIDQHEGADIQIHGDFNMSYIDWKTRNIDHRNRTICEQNSAKKLLAFMERNLLVQLVTESTRKSNLLDLCLTNNDHAVHSVYTEDCEFSDHDFINCNLLYQFKKSQCRPDPIAVNELDKINLNRADWESIRKDLHDIKWENILNENENVECMFQTFETTITNVCTSHAPKRNMSHNSRLSIPRHRQSILRTRRHVNQNINLCKSTKPVNHEEKLKKLLQKKAKLEIQLRDCVRADMEKEEAKMISKIKTNPRAFYTYAKKHCKTYCSVGPLTDENNELQTDPTKMCNLLQKQYLKAFSDPNSGTKKPSDNQNPDNPILSDIDFTEEDITWAINQIPVHSAPGPDKIPSLLLKECKRELAPALLMIWRKSLDTGEIPEILKKQSIVPIHKKDSKALPANYRPISLTSHITKLFERILRRHIVAYLEANYLIHNSQHGFRPCRSCLTQLLHHMDSILSILEKHKNADVIYLDLSKAFDKVNHSILMHKIKQIGITGKVGSWIHSFLSNRTQQVVIDGAQSTPEKVLSGVPQGTVLGPVLFIIYMNDLHSVVKHSLLKCFADDSKLIKSIENQEDREKLIEDLEAVLQWTKDNSMEFNSDKFQLIQHGKREDIKIPYNLPSNLELTKSEAVKDLGTQVSEDLTWRQNINTLTTNATRFANWILRTIKSRESEVMLTMYRSYVLSRLEYNSPVWNPILLCDIIKVEAVQRTFTSKIHGLADMNYWERLSALKLFSLQRRRERFCILHIWKIYKQLAPNDSAFQFYEHNRLGPQCRRINYPCKVASTRTLRFNSFSCIGPRLFNIIPGYIKQSANLNICKGRLDKLLLSLPDEPPTPGYRSSNSNSLLEMVRLINSRAPGGDDGTAAGSIS